MEIIVFPIVVVLVVFLFLPCVEPPEIAANRNVGKLTAYRVTTESVRKTSTAMHDVKTVLHVPKGCKQKYLDHPVWGKLFGGDKGEIKDDIK